MVSMSSIMLKPDFSFLMIAAIFITIRSAVKIVIIMQNTALAGISKGSEENSRTVPAVIPMEATPMSSSVILKPNSGSPLNFLA